MSEKYSDGEDQYTPDEKPSELTEETRKGLALLWHKYAGGVGAGVVLMLIAFFIVDAFVEEANGGPFAPLDYTTPQPVLNANHQIPVGGELVIESIRCNASDEDLTIIVAVRFQEVVFIDAETGHVNTGRDPVVSFDSGSLFEANSCRENVGDCSGAGCAFRDALPLEVEIGFWKEVGIVTVHSNGDTQVTGWESEIFEVVENG